MKNNNKILSSYIWDPSNEQWYNTLHYCHNRIYRSIREDTITQKWNTNEHQQHVQGSLVIIKNVADKVRQWDKSLTIYTQDSRKNQGNKHHHTYQVFILDIGNQRHYKITYLKHMQGWHKYSFKQVQDMVYVKKEWHLCH